MKRRSPRGPADHSDLPLFSYRHPMGRILAFPSERRVGTIDRLARRAAEAKDPEPTISHALARIRHQRTSCGLSAPEVDADMVQLERALRRRVDQYRATMGRDAG
jgi:hypothetical protein